VVFGTTILGSNPSAPAKSMKILEILKKIFFPFYKSENIKQIFKILNEGSDQQKAMFVGGCVRKHLLSQKVDDIDIATTLKPEDIIKKFENSGINVKKTGIEHGTLTLVLNNKNYEITTLRKDISTDGRHAVVSFSDNWEEDSKRRDFTINAIYLNYKGQIFDPQLGVKDLKNKKIKFIGNSDERIKEDYLRILRFLRFSIEYSDYNFDKETIRSIQKNLNGILKLSKERIYNELKKILKLKNFDEIHKNKNFLEIFSLVFPEFKYIDRLKNFSSVRKFMPEILNFNNILSSLLIDGSNNHEYFSHKYKISNETRDHLAFCGKNFKEIQSNKIFFKRDLSKNIFIFGKDRIKSLFLLNSITKKNFKLKDFEENFLKIDQTSVPMFPITGEYLLERGIKSGRKMGQAISEIKNKWVENNFNLDDKQLAKTIKKFK
tara:strand:+ start:833 stop:2134 length:1302 start_codon:yes stop_codon:yes gene_type:complete